MCVVAFSLKGSKMEADWSAFINLVSVKRRIFFVPFSWNAAHTLTPAADMCAAQPFLNVLPPDAHTHEKSDRYIHRPQSQTQTQSKFLRLSAVCQYVDKIHSSFCCHRQWNMFAISPVRWCVCLCSLSLQLVKEPGQSVPAGLLWENCEQKY